MKKTYLRKVMYLWIIMLMVAGIYFVTIDTTRVAGGGMIIFSIIILVYFIRYDNTNPWTRM